MLSRDLNYYLLRNTVTELRESFVRLTVFLQ